MTFGSLFTGIGGLDLGLERAGMECRWQCEIEAFPRLVLAKHWPNIPCYEDVRKIGADIEPVDLICGGYPCQPFSQAGKRGGAEDPRHLWPEFARIIRLLRPRYVLLENVPGHLSLGFGDVLGDLAGLGFDAEWTCVRAADVGASHLRKRVFVVANARGSKPLGLSSEQRGSLSTTGRGSEEVAYRAEGGRRELRQPSWEDGLTDGRNEELVDSSRDARDGSHGQDGPRRGVCEAGDELADAASAGREEREPGRLRELSTEAGREVHDRPELASGELGDPTGPRLLGREPQQAFAPGPGDDLWTAILRERPDLAPALAGRLNPRFVSWLMGFPIRFTEIEHEEARRPVQGRSNTKRVPEANRASEKAALRAVPDDIQEADASSQGQRLEKQRPEQYPDAMQLVSHLAASCERGDFGEGTRAAMQILSASDVEAYCLQYMSDTDKAEWSRLSIDDKISLLMEAGIASRALSSRTKRLKGLGNAVVPQVAEWVGRLIVDAERRARDEAWGRTIGEMDLAAEAALRGERA